MWIPGFQSGHTSTSNGTRAQSGHTSTSNGTSAQSEHTSTSNFEEDPPIRYGRDYDILDVNVIWNLILIFL